MSESFNQEYYRYLLELKTNELYYNRRRRSHLKQTITLVEQESENLLKEIRELDQMIQKLAALIEKGE